jgi:hypothetical protein
LSVSSAGDRVGGTYGWKAGADAGLAATVFVDMAGY